MIDVTSLRAGTVFEDPSTSSGQGLWLVLKYEHVKMGRGTANIKLKVKSLKSKVTKDMTFLNGARVQEVSLTKRRGQYLYRDKESFVFMDPVTFGQFTISQDTVGDQAKFLKEGTEVDLKFYKQEPLSVTLPLKMNFKVTETEPGFKGNSVTNISKDAVIETGAKIKVPLFVDVGDQVVINTETGEYVQRAK